MNIDPSTTKYLIKAKITADGIVEKPDVVGAIFGQTEGLLGEELDLRDLQKSQRIGRIEVEVQEKKGKSEGEIIMPSSLDQVETSILASALETIDRVGPCKAKIDIIDIEDTRVVKRNKVVERAKTLLLKLVEQSKSAGINLTESVRQAVQIEEVISYGADRCPAGPNVESSDAIIIVEGRNDVINLLKYGIKNAIAVEGTSVPKTIVDLSKEKSATVFVDGDRGGELILRELLQVAEIDFITRAPKGKEVEELTQKQIVKALRNKVPMEQFIEMYGGNNLKIGEKLKEMTFPFDEEDEEEKLETTVKDTKEEYKAVREEKVVQNIQIEPTQPISQENEVKKDEKIAKKVSTGNARYKELLTNLSGSLRAIFLDANNNTIKEILIRDLQAPNQISENTVSIVFDGIITQRLLNIVGETKVKTIIGVKLAPNISKIPNNIKVISKKDLE